MPKVPARGRPEVPKGPPTEVRPEGAEGRRTGWQRLPPLARPVAELAHRARLGADSFDLWDRLGVRRQVVCLSPRYPRDWVSGKPLTTDLQHTDDLVVISPLQRFRFLTDEAGSVGPRGPSRPASCTSWTHSGVATSRPRCPAAGPPRRSSRSCAGWWTAKEQAGPHRPSRREGRRGPAADRAAPADHCGAAPTQCSRRCRLGCGCSATCSSHLHGRGGSSSPQTSA